MTRSGHLETVRLSGRDWMAIVGLVLTVVLAMFAGAAWAYNVLDARLTRVEQSDLAQNLRILSTEKDADYSVQRFEKIDEKIDRMDRKLDLLIDELRKQ